MLVSFRVMDLELFSMSICFFFFFLLKALNKHLFIVILVFNMLFKLTKLVHQCCNLSNPIVMVQYTSKLPPTILILALFKVSSTFIALIGDEGIDKGLHVVIVGHIVCEVAN